MWKKIKTSLFEKKRLRQKQKAVKKRKKKLPLLRQTLEMQEHAVELSVSFTTKN